MLETHKLDNAFFDISASIDLIPQDRGVLNILMQTTHNSNKPFFLDISASIVFFCFVLFFVFCVPQLYLWGSPFLGEIFAYVTVF